MAGVPVYAEKGRRGGWALLDSYRTDLTGLTETELRSLVIASAPGVLADLGLGEAADRALIKLLAGLPEARRRAAESARGYLYIDPSGWRRPDEAAPFLGTLELALRTGRQIDDDLRARLRPVGRRANREPARARREGQRLVPRRDRRRQGPDVPRLADPGGHDPRTPVERPRTSTWRRSGRESSAEFRAAFPVHRFVMRVAPEAWARSPGLAVRDRGIGERAG